MALRHDIDVAQLLYVIAHLDVWNGIDDAALLNPLDERISRAIVRDRQPEGVLTLDDVDLLRPAFDVGKYEVVQADLTPQQLGHV